jgi:hypothetical protein
MNNISKLVDFVVASIDDFRNPIATITASNKAYFDSPYFQQMRTKQKEDRKAKLKRKLLRVAGVKSEEPETESDYGAWGKPFTLAPDKLTKLLKELK